jgi:magnesium-transporting ATPase (P-type)
MKYFPFTSERKASSLVVKDEGGRVFAFVKGADSSIRKIFKPDDERITFVDQEVESYAEQGLRTLVFGYKEIEKETLGQFERSHQQRQDDLNEMKEWDWDVVHASEIESNLTPLGVTAVEDLLQEGVKKCIIDFKEAGVKVWMLTGDKGLTAKMIGL